jgi:mannosyltransferase OCH1-like enzyme
MQFCSDYRLKFKSTEWDQIKKRFSEFQSYSQSEQKIPKNLHQIWLGSDLPKHYKPLIKKLKKLHPDWEYKLWTEDNIDFELLNPDLFRRAKNMGQKSDILRYEILNKHGGVYLDLDHLAVRSFNSLIHLDSFAGLVYYSSPQITNGVIGSIANSRLTKTLCKFEAGFIDNPNIQEVFNTTGPQYFTQIIQSLLSEEHGIVVFPNSYFSPYPNFPRDRLLGADGKCYIQKETICCHLWHCSWIKKY